MLTQHILEHISHFKMDALYDAATLLNKETELLNSYDDQFMYESQQMLNALLQQASSGDGQQQVDLLELLINEVKMYPGL